MPANPFKGVAQFVSSPGLSFALTAVPHNAVPELKRSTTCVASPNRREERARKVKSAQYNRCPLGAFRSLAALSRARINSALTGGAGRTFHLLFVASASRTSGRFKGEIMPRDSLNTCNEYLPNGGIVTPLTNSDCNHSAIDKIDSFPWKGYGSDL